MKPLYLLALLMLIISLQDATAQKASVRLIDPYPQADQTISVEYIPGNTRYRATIPKGLWFFFVGADDYTNTQEAQLLNKNGKWIATISIPTKAKAFQVRPPIKEQIYISGEANTTSSLIYKGKYPAENAYIATMKFVDSPTIGYTFDLYRKEFELYPHSRNNEPNDQWYFGVQDTAYALQKVDEYKKSDVEKVLLMASALLRECRRPQSADSLNSKIKAKFPNGILIRRQLEATFKAEADPAKKQVLFSSFLAKYPNTTAKDQRDMMIALKQSRRPGNLVANMRLYSEEYLPDNLNSLAGSWAYDSLKIKETERLSKLAIQLIAKRLKDPKRKSHRMDDLQRYDRFRQTYAGILLRLGRTQEALDHFADIDLHNHSGDENFGYHYISTLTTAGQNEKALAVAEKCIALGACYPFVLDKLKDTYIKIHGSAAWYNRDSVAMEKRAQKYHDGQQQAQSLASYKKQMLPQKINLPAPVLTLKDIDGNSISLANLKGKTIVLSIGATWSGLTGTYLNDMQSVMNSYAKDPNIVFAYIDTQNNNSDRLTELKEFINDHGYTFKILVDSKITGTKTWSVAKAYDVTGLPTRYVIDRAGRIRFEQTGVTNDSRAELEAMIELTKASK